jgi:hypothetical protein
MKRVTSSWSIFIQLYNVMLTAKLAILRWEKMLFCNGETRSECDYRRLGSLKEVCGSLWTNSIRGFANTKFINTTCNYWKGELGHVLLPCDIHSFYCKLVRVFGEWDRNTNAEFISLGFLWSKKKAKGILIIQYMFPYTQNILCRLFLVFSINLTFGIYCSN